MDRGIHELGKKKLYYSFSLCFFFLKFLKIISNYYMQQSKNFEKVYTC